MAKIILTIILIIVLGIFGISFMAIPNKVSGKPVATFKLGESVLSEKISYALTSPSVGDRVIFKDEQSIDVPFIGVISKITVDNKGKIIYEIISSNPANPWKVQKDKILSKIYYPIMSAEEAIQSLPAPTPTITSTPTPTPTPTPIEAPKTNLIKLHIDSIDYSEGHAAGLVTKNIKVRLYKMDGTLIEEKTPSEYIQNGPVGTGGDTIFDVLPSTYKIISETDSTSGSCIITVRSTTEYNSCGIYLVKK